jgi:hypothetical protein
MNDSHPICCNRNKAMLIERKKILPYFSHCCKIPVPECVKCAVCSSTTTQQWEQFSQYNVARAQEEMQASLQLREDMSVTRAQV